MAIRTVEEIEKTVIEAKVAEPELAVFTTTSQTSLWGKFVYIFSFCANIIEQIWENWRTEQEGEIAKAAPGSDYWIQQKVLAFQYSATNPQATALNNDFVPSYAVIDDTLKIISRASVKTGPNKNCLIKVATGDPPAALSGPQLTALAGYINNSGSPSTNGKGIGFAGVQYVMSSIAPDLLYIVGDVQFDGQYQAVIQANVITAINTYLAEIPFDGIFRIHDLLKYIKAVPGVIDVLFNDIGIRADAVAFPGYQYLVVSNYYGLYEYPMTAGYMIGETTLGNTWADTITFTAQN